jgi:hypothetical protein
MLNILMLAQKYGILLNDVDDQTLDQWKDVYQKTTITKNGDDNCWGIDKKCYAYNWFLKKVMPVIGKTFDEGTKLIFSSFMDSHTPIKMHTDLKPLPEGESGKHYLSILIPYSVDYKKENYDKLSTCFYNNDKQLVKCIDWEENCLIWWNSNVLHASADFNSKGIKSKQYFITHTYV